MAGIHDDCDWIFYDSWNKESEEKYLFIGFSLFLFFQFPFFIAETALTVAPIDQNVFRDEEKNHKILGQLTDKPDLKDEELQIQSMSLHTRNPVLHTGNYAVLRLFNNKTNLQDEYWFYPANPLFKWKKDADAIPISRDETISYSDINFKVIPQIINDTEKRKNAKETYYPGISIIVFVHGSSEWYWSVGVENIREHTTYYVSYDLDDYFIEERDDD